MSLDRIARLCCDTNIDYYIKADAVAEELRSVRLKEAARKVEEGLEETLATFI